MIEPQQLRAELAGPLLGQTVVGRPDEESPPRSFLGRVGQRDDGRSGIVPPDQRAATLMRVGFLAMPSNRLRNPGIQHQTGVRHRPARTSR